MKVVVDTSVWSLALRRRNFAPSPWTVLLQDVISNGRACLLGVVRQEILTGITQQAQFNRLQKSLGAFPDPVLDVDDYEQAAAFSNTCMRNGIHGSLIDFLICAFAGRRSYSILTADRDFQRFSRHLPMTLLRAR